jgi:hypothetical protein
MADETIECGGLLEFIDPLPPTTPVRKAVDNVEQPKLVEFEKDSVSELDSFHRSFSSVIVIAQCFGLMPVYGITGSSASFIR